MEYYFTKWMYTDFDSAITKTTEALLKEGFGIVTEIDMRQTLKNKLNVDFRRYKILGVCSPEYALKALIAESHIGTMMPCNLIVQEQEANKIEVSAVDPVASMMAIKNEAIIKIAFEVQQKLIAVINSL